MAVILPSSNALYDKMGAFRPEALDHRNKRFREIIKKSGAEEQCKDILVILDNQAEESHNQHNREGNAWRGVLPVSLAEIKTKENYRAEKNIAEQEIQTTLEVFAKNYITSVRIDIAIGPNSEILVGYNANGELNSEIVSPMLANLVNNYLFVAHALVTQDSTILQANSLGSLKKDSKDSPVPGTAKDIDDTLKQMQQRLLAANINCYIATHDYAEVKAVKDEKAIQQAHIQPVVTSLPVTSEKPSNANQQTPQST